MVWYKKSFGKDYLQVYQHRDDKEARQLVKFSVNVLGLEPGQQVLDLCGGYGRNAVHFSKYNIKVTCLDLSPVFVKMAKIKSGETQNSFHVIRGDMKDIPHHNAFDAVVSLFTSFGYFEKEEDNVKVLKAVSGALKPNGLFLLDYLNLQYALKNLVPKDKKEQHGVQLVQERNFNPHSFRLEKKITISDQRNTREYLESVRVYGIIELGSMFAEAGLMCTAVYGDYNGGAFTPDSPRLIMIGKKD